MSRAVAFLILAVIAALPAAAVAQWGDVKLSFVYDGTPPEPKPAVVPMDCALKPPVMDETWVVNPKGGGVQNVVVYLMAEKDVKLPIHPDFEKAKGTAVRIDNIKCRFEPRIAIKYTNQDLILGNKDGFGHNVKGDFFQNLSFNPLVPAKADVTLGAEKDNLNKHESIPATLACKIHQHMKGYLLIQEHPYAAVSDNLGNMTIKNVPQGEWTFVLWHETGYIQKGLLGTTPTEWKKGRVKIKVGPGVNTFGTVTFMK